MGTFREWLDMVEGSLGLKRRERVAAGLQKRADRERRSPGSDPSLWDDAASALGRFDAAAEDQQRRMAHGMWRKDDAARPGWLRRAVGRAVGMQEPERMPDDGDVRAMRDMGRAHGVVSDLRGLDGTGDWERGRRAQSIRALSKVRAGIARDHARTGSDLLGRMVQSSDEELRAARGV